MMLSNLGQISATFANVALATAGTAAVAIPVAIHLLTRLRRRPMFWAAMRFLNEAFRKHRKRLKLEQLLLLLVRCLLVLALAAALGRPVIAGLAGAWTAPPRLVYLVLDDSLSTQATDATGKQRFEALRQMALAVVDELGPTDRLWVIRAAAPQERFIAPVAGSKSSDPATARARIESIKPRYSRSELLDVLAELGQELADAEAVPDDAQVVVVVLSDFAAGILDIDQPLPRSIVQLTERATILLSPPAPPAPNVQIVSVRPRRRMVVAEYGTVSVPIELQLRRFGADAGEATTQIKLQLYDRAQASALSTTNRRHRWVPGENIATLNLDLSFAIDPQQDARTHRTLAIEATIDPGANFDVLQADNRRLSVVDVKSSLTVVLADAGDVDAGAYRPIDLLRFVLAPQRAATVNPVTLVHIDADRLDGAALKSVDAVIVLRPDLLTEQATSALATFTERGGVLWLVAPAVDMPATWATTLCRRLGLDWQIDIEPRTLEATADGSDPHPAFWTLALTQAPESLSRLSADWEALLRPIWVRRLLSMNVAGSNAQTWLETQEGLPVLVAQQRGDGMVLMLTTALDPDWTNLPFKKLFTPLIHDTLRSVLGSGRPDEQVCGRAVTLHRRFDQVAQLVQRTTGASIALQHSDEGTRPASGFTRPGLYTALDEHASLKLAVNVDADAGDLRAVDGRRLKALFGGQWIDSVDPGAALAEAAETTALGWPLLWVVLALALLETALARWFSHAGQTGSARPVGARWSVGA